MAAKKKAKAAPKAKGFAGPGRPKAITPDDLNNPDFLHTILAEALRNARTDRNRATKFLTKVIGYEIPDDNDASMNFKAQAVAKMMDSLSRINSQVVDVARMIIKDKDVGTPKGILGAIPIQEIGVDEEDLYSQFEDEEEDLPLPTESEKN